MDKRRENPSGYLPMDIPIPTPVYRILNRGNLEILLSREGLHAPNFTPNDGLHYIPIHNEAIQLKRRETRIPCGNRGVIHDYVPFYFGFLSPMLLTLHSKGAEGYTEGQGSVIYLVTSVQAVIENGAAFVFSDGHGIVSYTRWYDNPADLAKVDWGMVNEPYWRDTLEDGDRKRRKQAEFLVHKFCSWNVIHEVAVLNAAVKAEVESVFCRFAPHLKRMVTIRREWFYPVRRR
jgi:hypothetical protein